MQRGNNLEPCFFADEDYLFYLRCLGEAARNHACRVHAYVLMPSHMHLLATPRSQTQFRQQIEIVQKRKFSPAEARQPLRQG